MGYIKNPTQEKNGPMVNYSDENHPDDYYVPLQYEVKTSGVYTFEFHSITGVNPNSAPAGYHPTSKKAGLDWAQGNTAVAAWDITVLGKNAEEGWEVKSGRAWADYLALTTAGGEGIKSDLNVHVLTHDGYQYKVDFEEAVPNGFIFFANNTGFMTAVTDEDSHTTTYRPIYHSFYDSTNDLEYMKNENIYLHKPNEVDTETVETYKIFFNAPNDDLNGVSYDKNGIIETIQTAPSDPVAITELTFNGGNHQNIARTGHGGYFTFNASGEAMVTIRLDLRKAILDSDSFIESSYRGSGMVEITAPAVKGENSIYWDGKDTDGIVIPAGIYGDSNVVLATEIKRGELHFPVIDMEGLYGGLCVHRINGADPNASDSYNLYYNNNPLAYGNIEGAGYSKTASGSHYVLSDGTKSYKSYTDNSATLSKYFVGGPENISTLKKDDIDYLAQKLFNTSFDSLSEANKEIIRAEFGLEDDTFHFEPVNSSTTSMMFKCSGYEGGGNQAGIDAWTYYIQGIDYDVISFAVMDSNERGVVKGQIFYDANISSSYDEGDHLLSGVKVILLDKQGNPLVHNENLPCFDESGHFVYDENGKIKHEDKSLKFESVTDSTGTYRFTGVPYSLLEDTTYYVQVQLSDVQSEVLRYVCTTSAEIKDKIKINDDEYFLKNEINASKYGADGNKIVKTNDIEKVYGYKYDRDSNDEIVFDKENAQFITFSGDESSSTDLITVKEFKMIGYSGAVPISNRKDYKVIKTWGEGTHHISDGVIVELWVWNDSAVAEENALELSRRTGALMDTQVLTEDNHWTYTWENLDDRLQYYILEYYTKKKDNGEIIYNDRGEARKVLIGGTMPIFSAESSIPADKIYGFKTNLGDYPEVIEDPYDSTKTRIPIQTFTAEGENIHANSITMKEKLESVDNNARQYNVTYKLSTSENTNIIELINSQVYDDRTYYVWLGHQTELPDLIAKTFVENGKKKSHAIELTKDEPISDGEYTVKGVSISSVDAAEVENVEGNATKAFHIKENGKSALFTATDHGNYKTGTGTRTYQVKYVVDSATNEPVSVTTNSDNELVAADNENDKVENNSSYIVYSWYMTIHVYDVEDDGVIEYDPNGDTVMLQEALSHGKELKWKLSHDGSNYNSVSYTSDDSRKTGILHNDTYRLPLYKAAENPHMGSCADLVGIAYAGSKPVDDVSGLVFEDTYVSRYGSSGEEDQHEEDGKAVAQGSGGYVTALLNTLRSSRINRIQDHANYAEITFTPNPKNSKGKFSAMFMADESGSKDDVFYYKIMVFSEDSTYQYDKYEDIDASEGVVMYASFTMRPKEEPEPTKKPTKKPGNDPKKESESGSDSKADSPKVINAVAESGTTDESKIGVNGPKTGDESNILVWVVLELLGIGLIVMAAYLFRRRNTKK